MSNCEKAASGNMCEKSSGSRFSGTSCACPNPCTSNVVKQHTLVQAEQNKCTCEQTACSLVEAISSETVCGGDTAALLINGKISEIYEDRLAEIEDKANGDKELKVLTLNEWVKSLQHINKTLIENIQELELEATERLTIMQRKCNSCHHSSQGVELSKCRKDIKNLIRFIQHAKKTGEWVLTGFNFETLTENEIFGDMAGDMKYQLNEDCKEFEDVGFQICTDEDVRKSNECNCNGEKKKLIANIRALTIEIADKHDEVCELKKQICASEDEIQKAQKKIELKDNVIKEQRHDLKICSKCPTCKSAKVSDCGSLQALASSIMLPFSKEAESSARSNTHSGISVISSRLQEIIDSEPIEDDCEYNDRMSCLKNELENLFDIQNKISEGRMDQRRLMSEQQQKVQHLVQQWVCETIEANKKLDYFRNELINLDANNGLKLCPTDADSGFSSKTDMDHDGKLFEMVRKRIRKLNDNSLQLKKQIQNLEITNNELNSKLETQYEFSQKSECLLKEIACTLSDLTGKEVCYNKVYSSCPSQQNPFCDAIYALQDALNQKNKQVLELRRDLYEKGKEIAEYENVISNKDDCIADLERKVKLSDNGSESRHITTPTSSLLPKQKEQTLDPLGNKKSQNLEQSRRTMGIHYNLNMTAVNKNKNSTTTTTTTNTTKTNANKPLTYNQNMVNSEEVDKTDGSTFNPPAWNW